VECTIPVDTSDGDHSNVSLFARSDSGVVFGPLNLSAGVKADSRELEFSIPPTILDLPAAEGTVWEIRLNNRGRVPETAVLEYSAPSGWEVEPDFSRLSIAAEDSEKIRIRVLPGENPQPGSLTLTARSSVSPGVSDSIELDLPPIISIIIPSGPYLTLDDIELSADNPAITVFAWEIEGEEETLRGRDIVYQFQTPGDYDILLTGTKGSLKGFATMTIQVDNRPPELDAMTDLIGEDGKQHSLNAGPVASDADGTIVTFEWTIRLGEEPEIIDAVYGERTYYEFPGPGNYTVTLKVTDDWDASAETTFHYTIKGPDEDPGPVDTAGEGDNDVMLYSMLGIIAGIIVVVGLIAMMTRKTPPEAGAAHADGSADVVRSVKVMDKTVVVKDGARKRTIREEKVVKREEKTVSKEGKKEERKEGKKEERKEDKKDSGEKGKDIVEEDEEVLEVIEEVIEEVEEVKE
jgi:hypothetical protein